ncbi:Fbox domain containing protein [Acanthamoeba castellanii str. Neff]|uniref:Fbox domain containing protein n=1 Tax=Acanthamoeba castellanii (strain ATCC 30010 / Neff) TaxID=1257118 RepID=L8HMW1_ACACF|nr:Fbox domain containing protein [Acanthamoeba castellanii str. Neff]ELR25741.1 Fbox domain containing protein [Acanthamoeba castellanii str. Neff]
MTVALPTDNGANFKRKRRQDHFALQSASPSAKRPRTELCDGNKAEADEDGEEDDDDEEDDNEEDHFNALPAELQEQIFALVPLRQLLELSSVCRAWYCVLAWNDSLWHQLHRRHFGPVPPLVPGAPVVRYRAWAAHSTLERPPLAPAADSNWRNKCVAAHRALHTMRGDSERNREAELRRHRTTIEREERAYRRKRFLWAAMRNYVQLLREWLAEKGGEEDPEFIQEALVQAAKNGARETVELFVTLGIGLHAETAFLKEAFVFACIGGHPNVVKLFLSHGIKFDLGLIRAAEQGCTEIVGLLLEHGLPVDVRDLKGRTALMHAAMDNNLAMAQLLLEAGADVEAEDLASCTPLKYAAAAAALETGQLLVSRGADVNNCGTDPQRLLSPIARLRRGRDPHSAQRADEFIAVLLNECRMTASGASTSGDP